MKRSDFLKLTTAGTLGIPFWSSGESGSKRSKADRSADQPNIVFIFIDDMGYADLSLYGNEELQTPNMDRIGKEGVRFTDFYVASPICSPSRVGVMTGQYPSRWRINSFLATRKKNKRREMDDYLDPEAPSLPRAMKRAGYATAHFGKWHMGGGRDVDDAPLPHAYGFDESLVSFEGLGDRLLQKDHFLSEASAELEQGEIQWVKKWEKTGIYVDCALDFMERHQNNPFYLHLWPNDVHDPFQPKPEWREEFSEYDNHHYQRDFLAVLDHLDRQVGRVLDKLEELGLEEDTMVVFTSDNGPTDWSYYYEEYFWPPGSADPFRGRKWSLYEGGIREPFMIRWPGNIEAGAVNDRTIVHAVDLFPSLCSIAGVDPPDVSFDGEDLSDVLLGNTHRQRENSVMWEYGRTDQHLQPGNPRVRSPNLSIRDGKWKLLVNEDGSAVELYNLEKDLAETTNVKDDNPEITKRLARKVRNWREQMP